MDILEKIMNTALEFKHTRQVIFDFQYLDDETQGKRLILNCRKSEVKEISYHTLNKHLSKEDYYLPEKMIDDIIVESFLRYKNYQNEELFLNKAYIKDTNGNITELFKNTALTYAHAI